MDADPLTRDALAGTVDRFGAQWNAYELHGVEHIPRDSGCLLVLYHGLFVRSLGDRFLFRLPVAARLFVAGGAVEASPEAALRMLADGHPVLVSPGGVREALAGPRDQYRLQWGRRLGFARIAQEARVPLVPVFGENVEELYRAPWSGSGPVQWLYERTRLPIVPVLGLGPLPFPVKIRTWIGPPLHPRPEETVHELRDRVAAALQGLIDAHQSPSPRLLRGIAQRVGLSAEPGVPS